LLGQLRPQFTLAADLNRALQALLRDWGQRNPSTAMEDGRMLDQFTIDWFLQLNHALSDTLDEAALRQRMIDNVARMGLLAEEILGRARVAYPDIDERGLDALLAGNRAVSSTSPALLDPIWYADAA
jgi:hypothetical protein